MTLNVYIPKLNDVLMTLPLGNESPEPLLRSLLHESVHLTVGTALSQPADYQVLVAGRPTQAQIEASPQLHSLVIPFVGLPENTRELVKKYPKLRVHNLHHNAETTAEMAVTLLLSAAKLIVSYDKHLRQGNWSARYRRASGSVLLYGKTALILGYGRIGRHIVKACHGLGMKVIALRKSAEKTSQADETHKVHPITELHRFLPRANALVLALPLTDETEDLIGDKEIALLPDDAILVNVARGKIVDESALYHALKNGKLHSAGIDVWYQYPRNEEEQTHTPPARFPFHELDNVVMSPHRGGDALEIERLRMEHLAVLLNAMAQGNTQLNRVDVNAGY